MPNPKPTFDKIRALFKEEYGIDPGEPYPTISDKKQILIWAVILSVIFAILGILFGNVMQKESFVLLVIGVTVIVLGLVLSLKVLAMVAVFGWGKTKELLR
jgi:hypothetical protein